MAQQLTLMDIDPETCVIQTDVRNGYGAVNHSALLSLLRNRAGEAPFLYRFFNKYYTRANTLYGEHDIQLTTTTCIFQGDSLSSVLFCTAIDHAMVKANEAARDGTAMAYIDD